MPVKIRLQRKGKKRKPFYHIVIADSRSPRDGRFIEKIGTYNPMTKPATIDIDRIQAYEWLMKGAQPTDTVRAILRFKGVTYMKHLQRGVEKGAITQDEADKKLNDWVEAKDAKTAKRREQAEAEERAFYANIAGLDIPFKVAEKSVPKVEAKVVEKSVPKVEVKAAEEVDEAAPAVAEEATTPAVVEAVEATPEVVAEATPEVVAEEAPAVVEEKVEAPAAEAPTEEK